MAGVIGHGLNAGSAYLFTAGPAIACPGDTDGDGTVGITDFLNLLGAWGPCPAPPADCPADIDGNGFVDIIDFLALLAAWGACP